MTIPDLIQEARKEGVELFLRPDGSLGFRAHGKALADPLKSKLVAAKADILAFLKDQQAVPQPRPEPSRYRDPAPLTHAQRRMYYLDQLLEQDGQYNMATAFDLPDGFEADPLEKAMQQLLARHQGLSCRFKMVDGDPRQIPLNPDSFKLDRLHLGEGEPLQSYLAKLAATPIHLDQGFPCRINLVTGPTGAKTALFLFHHIVFDGWSYQVLFRELSAILAEDELPDVSLQISDIARWQQSEAAQTGLSKGLEFWSRQLMDVPALNALTTDRPRGLEQDFASAILESRFDRDLSDQIRTIAKARNVSLFAFLQAVFSLMISRWSGTGEATTGLPVSGRDLHDVQDLIGLFVNTVPIRIQPEPEQSFTSYLGKVAQQLRDCYSHQDVPFEQIVASLGHERDPAYPPLVQILLSFNQQGSDQLRINGQNCPQQIVHRDNLNFELELHVEEAAQEITLNWNYATALFDPATIQILDQSFQHICRQSIQAPESLLRQISLCSEDLPTTIDHKQSAQPQTTGFDHFLARFDHQVLTHGDAIACRTATAEISYAQLDQDSRGLAARLLQLGAQPGQPVGLYVEQSWEMVLGILSILRSGAAYLPLDPSFPTQRLSQILDQAQPGLIVGRDIPEDLGANIDYERIDFSERSAPQDLPEIDPQNAAYFIFTSGSTGVPKGVEIPHSSLNSFLQGTAGLADLGIGSVLPLITTISFDIHVVEIQHALSSGATIAILPKDALTDPQLLALEVSAHHVSHMHATPATWRMLIDHGWKPDRPMALFSGGDILPDQLKDRLLALHPEMRLWNYYGPTEATVYVSAMEMHKDTPVTIGRTMTGNQFHILDEYGHPAPPGMVGELYISGGNLARGYLGDEARTRAHFGPLPLQPEIRAYATGDLARRQPDGNLQLLGRRDYQIKLNGYRIELGEIENCLARHEAVREAAVLVRGVEDKRHLCAYLSLQPGCAASTDMLRHWLMEHLPSYMLPSQFILLDQLPETSNRKLDRKALLAMELKDGIEKTPPETETEQQIAALWQTLLGTEIDDIHTSFFQFGGHSLLAIKMLGQLENETGIRIPLKSLLATPGILGLAQLLDARTGPKQSATEPALETLI